MLCYSIAFSYPELIAQNTKSNSFFGSAVSVILVSILTSVLLLFLIRLYEEENEFSRQQKKEIEELNRAENHFFFQHEPWDTHHDQHDHRVE